MRVTLCIFGLLLLACSGGGEEETDDVPEADADTDVDADSDSDADGDADTGWMTPEDPTFTAVFDGSDWVGQDGHFIGGGDSYLVASKGDAEVVVVLDGDVRDLGTFEVSDVSYYETVHNGFAFNYQLSAGSATFEATGIDADEDFIWGELAGQMTLTDSEGAGDVTLEGLELVSWPRYGTQ